MKTNAIRPGLTFFEERLRESERKTYKCAHCGTVRHEVTRCESCGSPHIEGPRYRDVFECHFEYVASNPVIRMNYVKPEKGSFGRFLDWMNTHEYDRSIY